MRVKPFEYNIFFGGLYIYMDFLRTLLGTQAPTSRGPQKEIDPEEYALRAGKLRRAQEHRVASIKDELSEVKEDLQTAIEMGDRVDARRLLMRKKTLSQQLQQEEGRLANLKAQDDIVLQGESNLEQAHLTRDAAARVTEVAELLEDVDIEDAVDDLLQGKETIDSVTTTLSDPFLETSQYGNEVDDELDRIMSGTPNDVVLPSVPAHNIRQRPVKTSQRIRKRDV